MDQRLKKATADSTCGQAAQYLAIMQAKLRTDAAGQRTSGLCARLQRAVGFYSGVRTTA